MTFCHYPLWASYTIDTTISAYPVRQVQGKALGLTYHRTRYPVRLVWGKLSSDNHIAYPMPNTIFPLKSSAYDFVRCSKTLTTLSDSATFVR